MRIDFKCDLTQRQGDSWFIALDRIADQLGYYENLGPDHVVVFLDAGPKLLVTFESAPHIWENSPTNEPRGFQFVREDGWSHLAIISKKPDWFRSEKVYRYFDRLTDEGFLEDFSDVLFYGAGACGYAAAAYSVASPGARVLLFSPQATLEPRFSTFDIRYKHARRQDFTSRYGYAPDMIDAAKQAYLVFDPRITHDATHAALFRKEHLTYLPCPAMGSELESSFDALDIHKQLMRIAMEGALTPAGFARLIRQRRVLTNYQRNLFNHMIKNNHPKLARLVATYMKDRDPVLPTSNEQRLDPIKA